MLSRNKRNRRGATTVEFTLVLPMIFLFVLGLFEWGRFEMVRQVMSTATFNGARVGSLPGMTSTDVENRVNEILNVYRVTGGTTTTTINAESSTVNLQVPVGPNSFLLKSLFGDMTLEREFTLDLDK